MKRFRSVPAIAAAVSVLLALIASAFIVFWPCSYRGAEETAVVRPEAPANDSPPPASQRTTTCKSFLEMNGAGTLWVLALPTAISALGLCSSLLRSMPVAYFFATLLLFFCLMTGFSIGLLFFPATAALFVAAATSRKRPAQT